MRDQKVQTETVEIRDQQDTRVQEQGSLLLDAKRIFVFPMSLLLTRCEMI